MEGGPGPGRIQVIRSEMGDAEAVLISNPADLRWAVGFTGSNGLLLVQEGAAILLTDGRYTTQAAQEVEGADIRIVAGDLRQAAIEDAGEAAIAYQSDHVTVAQSESMAKANPAARWLPRSGLLSNARATKSREEIRRIRAAQRLTETVFRDVVSGIQEGVTEQDVAAAIVHGHLRGGASGMAFDPIVAFGSNAALPHARPTTRRLAEGDPILVDIGCYLDGYASDMTRMLSFGTPHNDFVEVFELVRSALEAALRAARSGITSRDLDASARHVIASGGLGEAFSHSLGHGVGLEVHEAPSVSWRSEDVLPDQAVVTLEPGIYLPGRFGVRIEDIVVLNPTGCRRVTDLPHDLIVL